jgi:hypothetical protein
MRGRGAGLGSAAGRPHGRPAGRGRANRPPSRHNVMARRRSRSRPRADRRRLGSPDVPLPRPPKASHLAQSRGSPTSPRRGWRPDERCHRTCTTHFRRARPILASPAPMRAPRRSAPAPQRDVPRGARRSNEAHASKRGGRGTRPVRRGSARTHASDVPQALSRRLATVPRSPMVVTRSPTAPVTGECGGLAAIDPQSPCSPSSRRSGEGRGTRPTARPGPSARLGTSAKPGPASLARTAPRKHRRQPSLAAARTLAYARTRTGEGGGPSCRVGNLGDGARSVGPDRGPRAGSISPAGRWVVLLRCSPQQQVAGDRRPPVTVAWVSQYFLYLSL